MIEITENKTMEEKLTDKLTKDIGDLIGKDEIEKIVSKGVENLLFKKRYTTEGHGYNARKIEKPSISESVISDKILTMAKEELEKQVNEKLKELDIESLVRDTLETNAQKLVLDSITSLFTTGLQSASWNIQSEIQNRLGVS